MLIYERASSWKGVKYAVNETFSRMNKEKNWTGSAGL